MLDFGKVKHLWVAYRFGLCVTIVTLAVMLATEPRMAIVWDEGYTLGREARIRLWLQALRNPAEFAEQWTPPGLEMVQQDAIRPPRSEEIRTRADLFSKKALEWFWPFAREEPHGHPPFYAIVGMVGDVVVPSWEILPRARFGPILIFSLTAGALAAYTAKRWGPCAACATFGAWVLQPHLFAHGHYATLDALVTSLWVLGLLAFAKAIDSPASKPVWGWAVIFGIVAGCLADTKLTGWFLPIPVFCWTVLARDKKGLWTLLIGGLIGVMTLYVCNPCWWNEPIDGVIRFLRSNLTRGKTIPIPVLFLGKVVKTPVESLPFYNTLVWTVFASPVGFLLLALVGLARGARKWKIEPVLGLGIMSWAFLLALRSLPHTPGHDGTRQILAAFGVMAILVGAGAAFLVERYRKLSIGLTSVAIAEALIGLVLMFPVPLSYYSPLVGGLAGATKLGMEPTYFWDGLSDEALDWLNEHTPPGQKVRFATFPTSWLYLKQVGKLKPEILPNEPGVTAYYVLQNRPGAFTPLDTALISRGRPEFVESKAGVPLVLIYPYRQVESLMRGESP